MSRRTETGRIFLRPPSVKAVLKDPATIMRHTRAAIFVALVVLASPVWDTGADPVRLARGVPWILDFVGRMLPPDLRVLPAALRGAVTTVEIALLGTAVAAVVALPLGFLSARNVAPAAVFYPARAVLNFF